MSNYFVRSSSILSPIL